MGHIVNPDKEYRYLQKHLDESVTGAPHSPALMKILRILFTPEEANLARSLPFIPRTVSSLSRNLKIPEDELNGQITEMARKGLVIDLEMNGRRFVVLAPVVIGFFEFTFMRAPKNLPMKELAELFETYMFSDEILAKSIFQGETQIGRSLVREEALSEGDYSEILDFERATRVVEQAKDVGISTCACRQHHTLLDKACERPLRTCMTLNYGVASMVKHGIAERITNKEALTILEECKENGLAQTGDNVKSNMTYICNCCGCCCGMMSAIRTLNIKNAIVSSNYIMEVDLSKCKGCGKCAKACPIDAIEAKQEGEGKKKKRWSEVDESLCLGCGVCHSACKFGAISMRAREQRVFTPDTVFDKMVAMGIERGKLAPLVFSDPNKLSHRALGRVMSILEKSPPYKAMMAVKPLRSAYFNTMVGGSKKLNKTAIDNIG